MKQTVGQVELTVFYAISYLVGQRLDAAGISKVLGLTQTGHTVACIKIARMPEFIRDEYRKLILEGRKATSVWSSDVGRLYHVFNLEYVDHPDGDGPKMCQMWEQIQNRKE